MSRDQRFQSLRRQRETFEGYEESIACGVHGHNMLLGAWSAWDIKLVWALWLLDLMACLKLECCVFLWGAHPTKKLLQIPLPTHDIIGKGLVSVEFEDIYVKHSNDGFRLLEKALVLKDAISDLPET